MTRLPPPKDSPSKDRKLTTTGCTTESRIIKMCAPAIYNKQDKYIEKVGKKEQEGIQVT